MAKIPDKEKEGKEEEEEEKGEEDALLGLKALDIAEYTGNYLKWSAENVAEYVCKSLEHIPSITGRNHLFLLIVNAEHHKKEVRCILIKNGITGEKLGLIVGRPIEVNIESIKKKNLDLWEKAMEEINNYLKFQNGCLPRVELSRFILHPVVQNIFDIPFKLNFESKNGILLLLLLIYILLLLPICILLLLLLLLLLFLLILILILLLLLLFNLYNPYRYSEHFHKAFH
jgi:hypothetical protein